MACSSCGGGSGQLVLLGQNGVEVTGSGTATDPYVAAGAGANPVLQLQVRDSSTVNLTKFGSGTPDDPYILQADTSSAASLRGLGDVSASPSVVQGAVPLWIGSPSTGHFELRLPGTRYTTNAARGSGVYQGEQIKETDTGKRYEWDGTQWVSLDVATTTSPTFGGVMLDRGTLASSTDWNTLSVSPGIYRVSAWDANKNTPPSAYNYGTLVVSVSGNSTTQQYFAHQSGAYMYWRTKWNATDWSVWNRAYTGSEATALTTRVSGVETRATTLEGTATSLDSRLDKLEAATTSVVQTGSVTYGSNVGANNGCDLTKAGIHVVFRFNLSISGSKNINDNLVQLPSGFRPRSFPADGFAHNGSSMWGIAIDTDGWLRLRTSAYNGGGGLWGNISFQAA